MTDYRLAGFYFLLLFLLAEIKSRKKHSGNYKLSSYRAHRNRFLPAEKDNSFLRIGSLRIGNLLGVNTKLPQVHHHQQIRSSAPPSSFDMKLHKSWGSADNVLPHSVRFHKIVCFNPLTFPVLESRLNGTAEIYRQEASTET